MDASKLAELKAQHPEGKALSVEVRGHGIEVFIRPPARAEYRRFRTAAFDERKRADSGETLVRSVIVYPDATALDAMLEKFPGLVETFLERVLELAGAGAKVEQEG